jgi:predicted nuclease of predicted toxin-antitoxin system
MRFLLDENIHPGVAEAAWELPLDVVSVHDLRRRGRSDHDQLAFAAEQDRVLVTRNREDYLHWTREFYRAGRPHRGVLLVDRSLPNDQPAMIARALRRWVQAHSYTGANDVAFGAYHVDFLKR